MLWIVLLLMSVENESSAKSHQMVSESFRSLTNPLTFYTEFMDLFLMKLVLSMMKHIVCVCVCLCERNGV